MQFIVKIIGYIALVPAAIKGFRIGYRIWEDSVHSEANDVGNPNFVQLLIYGGMFTFFIWLAIIIPVYIFYKIWWLAFIVGGVIFFIYKKVKDKKSGSSDSENTCDETTKNE